MSHVRLLRPLASPPVTARIETADGVSLEAEWAPAPSPRAGVVLCHPHPEYGGTMRSIVISALFEALPASGVHCLRFNFRGVEGSSGAHGGGRDETHDVIAALDAMGGALEAATPVILVGWSFGGDVALSVVTERLAGWVAIAAPLRWGDPSRAGFDSRPKQLLLAEHDEFAIPEQVRTAVEDWPATELATVAGASHFFVGRTDRVSELTLESIDRMVSAAR